MLRALRYSYVIIIVLLLDSLPLSGCTLLLQLVIYIKTAYIQHNKIGIAPSVKVNSRSWPSGGQGILLGVRGFCWKVNNSVGCSCRATSAILRRHQLTHSGEKSFTCFKKFSQAGHLRRQKLTHHSGEKFFTCETCLKKF